MKPEAEVKETDDDTVRVTVTPRRGNTITGWPEAAEDLDLLGPGPKEAHGIKATNEIGEYHNPGDEYPYGYSQVVLVFEDEETLEWARERLYEKATERFEWGASDAEDVQDFAGALPSATKVEQ